jgi:hypothetical protein
MKLLAGMLCALILASGCAGIRGSAARRGERLATERGRLADLTDAVERTKSHIVIGDLFLSFAADAARERALEDVDGLLEQYTRNIRAARDTMVESDRDPRRYPAGYRDLDGALRRHAGMLREIRSRLAPAERNAVDRAMEAAAAVRAEMAERLHSS